MKFVWIGHLLISPTNLDTIRINLRKSHYKWSKAISTEMNLVAMEMKSFQLKWFFFLNASGPHAGPLLISPTILDTFPIIWLVITIMSKNSLFFQSMTLIEANLFQSWSDALYAVKVKRLKVVETNSFQSWTETLNRIQLQGLKLIKTNGFQS